MRLYGWLIGRWEMDSVIDADDGTKQSGPRGEIHFGWVLEGRAIQDVWILPGVFYGTTLRVYDPGLDAWHILWSDPLRQVYTRQIGRARSQTGFIRLAADQESRNRASPTSGDDIVQEGKADDGTPMRWSFTEITPDSFHWLGERSPNGGKTWKMQIEFFARRAKS
ncbi:MAG TPA: hypothetical protein VKT73_13445 [Xanthobacteraceae bacterium]|nr:hypothetical protein [Xanthobacteraceae bacterium]